MRVLCQVGANRAIAMGRAGSLWHDLGPVNRALANAGLCWVNVGEVLAWNNHSGSGTGFMVQWANSPPHWSLLSATRFGRGGGQLVETGWPELGGLLRRGHLLKSPAGR